VCSLPVCGTASVRASLSMGCTPRADCRHGHWPCGTNGCAAVKWKSRQHVGAIAANRDGLQALAAIKGRSKPYRSFNHPTPQTTAQHTAAVAPILNLSRTVPCTWTARLNPALIRASPACICPLLYTFAFCHISSQPSFCRARIPSARVPSLLYMRCSCRFAVLHQATPKHLHHKHSVCVHPTLLSRLALRALASMRAMYALAKPNFVL
jgi:hypothetical protein